MPFDDPAYFRLDAIPVRPIHRLWRPYLAGGKLALLDGDPGTGKSAAVLAEAVQTGWALPNELKEPDFDALRGRPDFQKVVAKVEKPAADAPMPGEKK